jgi:predicted nucleic acid-binding protein
MRPDLLLDTSFIWALFPGSARLPDELDAWVIQNQDRFHVPTIAIAEMMAGIAKLRREGAVRRAASYQHWPAQTIELFGDRILPLDLAAGRRTGEFLDHARSIGHNPGLADIAVAAIADINGLIVLTRNLDAFTPLKIGCADPFKAPR